MIKDHKMDLSVLNRFWSKVDKPSNCWTWTSSTNPAGYGDFNFHGKTMLAHRLAWILTNGEVPDGMFVLHHCDNPACVNPEHLFLGRHIDNMHDCRRKNRTGRLCGDDSHHSKVTAADIREMVRLYESKEANQAQIADKYNIHPATVSRLVRGLGRRDQIKAT